MLQEKKKNSELLQDVLAEKLMTYRYVYNPAVSVSHDITSIT